MEVFGIAGEIAIILSGFVMGGVELVKRVYEKDWETVAIIIVAGLLGGLGGVYFGIDFITGIVYGLAASGIITLAQNIGKGKNDKR